MDFKRIVWTEYYYLTELFDSKLPHSKLKDRVYIVHPSYFHFSSQFSSKLLKLMRDRFGIYVGNSDKDLDKYSLAEITEMYERLPEKPLTRLLEEEPVVKRSSELWHGSKE